MDKLKRRLEFFSARDAYINSLYIIYADVAVICGKCRSVLIGKVYNISFLPSGRNVQGIASNHIMH